MIVHVEANVKLLTLYIDVLLSRLKVCGFGCYIGQSFVSASGYADAMVLLAPTHYMFSDHLINCAP